MLAAMRTSLPSLLLVLSLLPLPALAGGSPEAEPPQGLSSFRLFSALGRIAEHDPAGLGAEAKEAWAWAAGRPSLALWGLPQDAPYLSDGEQKRSVGLELGRALQRVVSYMERAAEARLIPVSFGDLAMAAVVPRSVEEIREAFDAAIDDGLVLDGGLVVPELGGEATVRLVSVEGVDSVSPTLAEQVVSLRLHRFEDPSREALVAVSENRSHPPALAALFEEGGEGLALLDINGQLEREVGLYAERERRGVPEERRRLALDRAIDTILRNGSDSFTLHPREQLELIIRTGIGQRGGPRLAGLWHLHPPGWSESGWLAAAPPSPDDRQIARAHGQFLTIVFRPDGFDLHDLQTPLFGQAPQESEDRVVRYRSEAWGEHFARRHAFVKRVKPDLTTSP